MPPEGSWRPNVNLESVLVSVYALLISPNLEDPVRPDLISEWKQERGDEKENSNVIESSKSNCIKRTLDTAFSLSLSALRKKPKS